MLTSRSTRTRTGLSLALMYAAVFGLYGIQLPYLPVWLSSRGLDAADIGVVTAAPLFVRILLLPAVGFLADRTGRHRHAVLIAAGCALAAVAALTRADAFWSILMLSTVFLVGI